MQKRNQLIYVLGTLFLLGGMALFYQYIIDPSQTNTGAHPTKNNPAPLSSSADHDLFGKYDKPIDMTVYAGINDVMKFAPNESIDDNFHTRIQMKYLNIHYINKWVADGSKINERLNLAIANNDLPDVIQVDISQLNRLIRNGQIQDLTGIWEDYASEALKQNMGYQDNAAFLPATKDKKIYGIPLPYDAGNHTAMMYIRKDWLSKLGLNPPTTYEELRAVAKAFVEQDPDGNSKNDTFAFSMDQGSAEGGIGGFTFEALAAAFHAYPRSWIRESNGSAAYGGIQPEMKEALAAVQDFYLMGAIEPEFPIHDLPKSMQRVINGKVGIVFGPFYYPLWPLKDTLQNDPKADWLVLPIPGKGGEKVVPRSVISTNNWVVVRKGYEHPEALVKSMNLYFAMQEGIGEVGQLWREANSGTYKDMSIHLYAKPYAFDSPNRNMQTGKQILETIDHNDESYLKTQAAKDNYFQNIKPGGLSGWGFRKVFYDAERVLAQYDKVQYSMFFGAPTPTMIVKGNALAKLEYEMYNEIIMGAPLSKFDDFTALWRTYGGDDITTEVNAWARANTSLRGGTP
ncbi:extracellular solute-binding protein [Paenibacillus roseipurpureus]|uniref:Extracellular solute-binding protein n=1 Tax=Paenibacillus roseopurpureus TaxID=2918901 RepID=A0AA96LTJ6_9BACL|nr:extracellular solute-binding protein [Paenibacillus sp. MBLB1832]WNR46256.1 extracellular solute-binding protein [Paenibacillus sp. MBLB1832]